MGWKTDVIKGNEVTLDSSTSPVINFANSEEDRKRVIGERSLNISDKIDFHRKVSQVISSSPFVKLNDGFYTLTATLRNSGGIIGLEMYAESAGKRVAEKIKNTHTNWHTIRLKRIPVRDGKVEVGFKAEGRAGASCQVDDVSLVLDK